MKYLFALVLSFLLSGNVYAKEAVASRGQCFKENISININYNLNNGKSFDEIRKMFDEQNAKIEEYAKQQKLTKFDLQSKNYNISASASSYDNNNKPEGFRYSGSGSASYALDNADAAFKFCEFLISQKIQVSMNSNLYNQGGGSCEKSESTRTLE